MKFPVTYRLQTERCALRYISKEDIPHIFSASRHGGFTDGMKWEPPETEQDLIAPYERNVRAWEEDQAYCFTIETMDSSHFVGRIVIRKTGEEGEGPLWDLGFWTHPDQQRNGYMTEAVGGILTFGFRELGAGRITAAHALWNKASQRVLQKNGMSLLRSNPEGFQKRGEWVAENLLGISREAWGARQTRASADSARLDRRERDAE